MIQNTRFDYQKATQAINYFASKSSDKKLNKMKALKLIWAADRYHIRLYGRPIIGDKYIAMKFGPVASKVKDILECTLSLQENEVSYSSKYISKIDHFTVQSTTNVDLDVFSESDLEALDFAYDQFGDLNPFDLSKLTHEYPEWKQYQELLESGKSIWEIISYNDFFKNPSDLEEDKFQLDDESLLESKDIFLENKLINVLL